MQHSSKANIVLFGRTGAGKSSFINYILGSKAAPTGCGEPVTMSFDEYEYALRNGISIRIFDSKGLEVDGYSDAVMEITDFIENRNNSDDVLDWVHSIFYCININRARLEDEEILFIQRISEIARIPVQIIITHCRGKSNVENEQAMQDRIRLELGEQVKIYCVNSVEKRLLTGEVVNQFGIEIVIQDLINLLWENTAKKIALNYAIQMRSGLFRIIEEIKREYISHIDNANVSDLKRGVINGGFEKAEDLTVSFIQEMNSSYNGNINSFLNMYRLFSNALGAKHIKQFSPYVLSYHVLFDDTLEEELENWYNRRLYEILNRTEEEIVLNGINSILNYRKAFKEPLFYLCQRMIERVPNQETIEWDIYEMLLKAKEENARHSPFVRVINKIGPNDPCPCGSGHKFKKCCMGKGLFD